MPELAPRQKLRPTDWQSILREAWFGLEGERGPSSRSLLSYFVRRVDDGGFQDAFKHSYQQVPSDYQVAVSFLLDLDWHLASAWDDVRKRDKNVRALSTALKEERLGPYGKESVARLRTEVSVTEGRVDQLRTNVENFHVVEAFADFETEANDLSARIRRLADENAIDAALIERI